MKDKGLINRFLDNRTTERIIVVFVFFVYGITVLWFTVFGRPIGRYSPYAELLWSFGKLLSGSWIIGKQILLNIAMFIPFGFLVPICIDKIGQNIILLAFLSIFFSGLIELLQTMLMRGSFEYDDIINNLFGAVTGWILFKIVRKMVFQKYRISIIALISTILMVACFKICIVNRNVLGDENSKNLPGLLCFQVDDLLLENNCLTLKGFTFRYDYKISEPEIKLKTKNTEIKMDVIYGIKRNDVNAFFVCKHDYSKTGFIASAVIDPDKEYEIIVSFGWLRDIPTDVYITGTNIHYVPDVAFIQPLSEGTALEPIVKNGYPRVFRSDYPFWVYQYKEALYWIADKDFCFEEDGSTYIQYQLWTTQPENLPKERLDNGWYWDNIGGNFEDYEITEMINCGQYRVMKRDLSAAYPVTSILTGYYKNGNWIWKDFFRPIYSFE